METGGMIQVEVKLFAALKEAYGGPVASIEVPVGTSVGDLPDLLFAERRRLQPGWPGTLLFAMDRRYVPPETLIVDEVEIALVPPLGGG